MSLSDKVALVTGSTSGIGLGIARALAAGGANVVLNGFGDKALVEKLLADLKSQYKVQGEGGLQLRRHVEARGDRGDGGASGRDLGSVDILVNNAGIQHVAPVGEFPAEKWDAVIAINLSRVELLREKQPSLEFATPEQIAAAALILCSPGAAQIRGIALPVDGGWTAQ